MGELREAIEEMRKLWPLTGWSKMKNPVGYAMYLRDGDESHAHPDDLILPQGSSSGFDNKGVTTSGKDRTDREQDDQTSVK